MWNFVAKLFGGGVSAVVDSAGGLVKTIWGDRAAKDAAQTLEYHDALAQFAAEFVARQQRTWWDSFIDGINRLPRPLMVFGVLASFIWPYINPTGYIEYIQTLALVPDPVWYICYAIVAFYFTARTIEKLPTSWKTDPKAMDLAKEIAAERTERAKEKAELAKQGTTTVSVSSNAQGETPTVSVTDTPGEPPAVVVKLGPPETEVPSTIDNSSTPERAVAATIWGEARSEPYYGKLAVGWVIRNRVAQPGWWGRDWISVCTAKQQFSCWWDKQATQVRTVDETDRQFGECLAAAIDVISGNNVDPTAGATHYFADTISTPKWARGKTPTTKIGHHIFYKIGLGA